MAKLTQWIWGLEIKIHGKGRRGRRRKETPYRFAGIQGPDCPSDGAESTSIKNLSWQL